MGEVAEQINSQEGSEEQGGTTQPAVNEELIEIARKVGWKEDGPLDAKTFIEKMPERFHEQTRTMQELKKSVDGITKHFAKTVEIKVKEQLSEMESRKEEAIMAGDVAAVKKIDKEIREIEKVEIPAADEIRPEVKEFMAKNPWFGFKADGSDKDEKLTRIFIAYKQEYEANHPNGGLGDSIAYAEEEIKKDFPTKFKTGEEEPGKKKPAAASVESPTHTESRSDTWQQMERRMSAFEKEAMEDMLKQSYRGKPVTTKEAYIKSLMAAGAFEGRK